MVHKYGLAFFALFSLVALGGFAFELKATITGNYFAAGGGQWYYGTMIAQMQPDEACKYSGYQPVKPWNVYRNEYNTLMSLCRKGNTFVGVPVVQTIKVNRPFQYPVFA